MVSLITHWFKPHYSNNHRAKLLQPTGLVALTMVFLLAQSSLQLLRLSPALPGGFVLGYASSISAAQVLEQTNNERTKAGLPALTINAKLNQAALAKASHMFQHDYWAHIAPDGTTPWVFIKNAGYSYSVAGENLARDFGDTNSMVQAWMNSPSHKENILRSKYAETGIAVVDGTLQGVETTLVVQMFGSPSIVGARTTTTGAQSDKVVPTTEKVVPNPTPIAVNNAVPEAALTPISVQSEPALEVNQTSPTEKAVISPLSVTKFLAASLVALLILVLTYDLILSSKQNLPRRVGNNWAHIGLFSVVLLVIIMITQGRIL